MFTLFYNQFENTIVALTLFGSSQQNTNRDNQESQLKPKLKAEKECAISKIRQTQKVYKKEREKQYLNKDTDKMKGKNMIIKTSKQKNK